MLLSVKACCCLSSRQHDARMAKAAEAGAVPASLHVKLCAGSKSRMVSGLGVYGMTSWPDDIKEHNTFHPLTNTVSCCLTCPAESSTIQHLSIPDIPCHWSNRPSLLLQQAWRPCSAAAATACRSNSGSSRCPSSHGSGRPQQSLLVYWCNARSSHHSSCSTASEQYSTNSRYAESLFQHQHDLR
jgi:hypothetical protein